MKLALILAAALASSACVGVKFYKSDTSGNIDTSKEVGLPFHESKPYLLVTRSGAKDGGVESKIIYLPDTTVTYYAKPDPVLIGSSAFTLTLTDGRLASFNGEVSADLAGLLADLVSPVKGLAEADAALAGAGLDDAEAEKIRSEIAKSAGSANMMSTNGAKGVLNNPNLDVCKITLPAEPPFNPQLSTMQATELLGGILDLACALKTYGQGASSADRTLVATAMLSLTEVYDADFLKTPAALALVILDKHPTASALRALIGPLKAFDVTPIENPSDNLKLIEERVLAAHMRVLAIADQIDPPKPSAPKAPYELFEIVIDLATKNVALRPVGELKGQ